MRMLMARVLPSACCPASLGLLRASLGGVHFHVRTEDQGKRIGRGVPLSRRNLSSHPPATRNLRPGCFSVSRGFSSTQVVRSGNKGEDDPENSKRLPSDDPNQLPPHFFSNEASKFAKPAEVGILQQLELLMTLPVLTRMSKGEFDREDFLEGCKDAFEHIMETYTRNSTDGFEDLMETDVLEAFKHCLNEYSQHGIVCDYESGRVKRAEIHRIQFVHDPEEGLDRAWVDVQFVNSQRICLRDETGRVVGPEGDWVVRSTLWRFSTKLPELKWVLADMP
uniref:Tim44-like domain-containing protein n=1 Tax=Hemiselmis tepida TaxID=464990 RepID=A0A7S0VQ55_9CRYP|mmetsp:Transcript_2140/g.5417  ORF Transcript_2140/g.5417 Transcript_2140/m.5417 type:complete len:279 (+) Transcript_2140:165-1001(+)